MAFYKKILVLKQAAAGFSTDGKNVSGIARIEANGREATLYLTLLNLASAAEGDYGAYVVNRTNVLYSFDLGKNPISVSSDFPSFPDLNGGFACAIAHRKKDGLTIVAYHATADFPLSPDRVKREIATTFTAPVQAEKTPAEKPTEPQPSTEPPYQDETVATENYYQKEDVDQTRLTLIEHEPNLHSKIIGATPPCADTQKCQETETQSDHDEANAIHGETPRVGHGYYKSVQNELAALFAKYPAEELLERSVEGSRFVKVTYAENRYYTVGLIRLDGKPRYICYGVPGKYSRHPPKELAGYCSFLPLSLFDLKGDGYWMLYQDADTGDAVQMNYVE